MGLHWRYRAIFLIVAAVVAAAPAAGRTTFGDPGSGPLPNITDIRIYDVTNRDAGFRETGGTLIDSGLNTTFVIDQEQDERRYRFSFRVNNTGSSSWTLENADELFHDQIDADWNVTKIWYNISQDYDGGTNDTRVTWNTGNGGTLDPNQVLYAKYLVNITEQDDGEFNQLFEANDTSANAGSQDRHVLDVNGLGWLNVTITEPPNDTVLKKNDGFTIEATAECVDGECGAVNLTARYNESSTSDTLIPTGSGTPFHIDTTNERRCDAALRSGETCSVSWTVNATGTVPSYHLLDVNASSNHSEIAGNDTEDRLVQVNEIILMDLSFDAIDFGLLDPGTDNVAAENNSELFYNVSFDDDSIHVDGLYVKSTPLVHDADPSYEIGPGNITVDTDRTRTDGLNLSTTYQLLTSDISPPANVTTFYWLDVPTGMLQGDYSGTVTFKANATL